jgi:hypothetical protein
MNKELVLGIFSRDYQWIQDVNDDVKITKYNKNLSNILDGETMIIPNVGRDVHTFFYHIVKKYNHLSDYTIFSQDWPFDHVSNYIDIINGDVDVWNRYAKQRFNGCWFFCSQYNVITCDGNGYPAHPGLNIVPIWEDLFNTPFPGYLNFTPTGHFGITKEHIHRYPITYYEKIMKILEEDPQSPWILERLEPYIFSDNINIKL